MRAAVIALGLVLAVAGASIAQPTPPTPPVRNGSGAAPTPGQPGQPDQGQTITITPGKPVMVPVRPGKVPVPKPPAAATLDLGAGSGEYHPPDHGDVTEGTSKLLAVCFWLFALVTIGGAVFVITRRNLIAAVMGMVGSFFGLAATYMMLYASFLAVVQMLVYAGAIMVLFVFVIMILNKPEDEPFGGSTGVVGKGLGGLGLAYLVFRLVALLWSVVPAKTSGARPGPVTAMVGNVSVSHPWGSTKAIGTELFNGYLFPFEAVSILLLVAVVGAIAVARPLPADEGIPPAPEDAP